MAYIGNTPLDVRSFGSTKFEFTATAGQTAFTGTDDNNITLAFTEDQIEVYVNGVLMDNSDFSSSGGNTVTLGAAAAVNDIVTVIAAKTNVPNVDYVAATGGTFTGAISGTSADFDGGVTIDNITIDGTEIDLSSGDLTIDVAGDIILDGDDNGRVQFHDGGTFYGLLRRDSNDFQLYSIVQDGDMVFRGNDGGSNVTALTLDMSNAGFASFNNGITLKNELYLNNADASATVGYLYNDSNNFVIRNYTQDKDIIFKGNDGGSVIEAMRIDMSEGGNVGIGLTNPSDYYSDDLVVSAPSEGGITIANTSTSGNNYLMFADGTSGNAAYRGQIAYDHSNDRMLLATAGSTRAVIANDGNIGVNTTSPVDFGDNFKNLNLNGVKGGALCFTRGTNSATRQWDIYTSDSDQLIFYRGGSTDGMVMKSDGTIGVNTNSPHSTFHVTSDGQDGTIRVGGNSSALGLELLYDQSGATVSYIQSNPTYTNTNSLMHIRVDGDANPNHLVLKGDGSMYIGTTSLPSGGSGGTGFRADSNGRRNMYTSTSVTSNQGHIIFNNPNGQVGYIGTNGSATTYHTSSDYRLKENVTNISDGITRVKQLSPKRFNFIADADTTVDGFLAHEAQTVVPEAIGGTKDEVEVWAKGEELPDGVSVGDNKLDDDGKTIPVMQGIDQSKLVPLLTAALQEAIAKIETLETKVAALEAK